MPSSTWLYRACEALALRDLPFFGLLSMGMSSFNGLPCSVGEALFLRVVDCFSCSDSGI